MELLEELTVDECLQLLRGQAVGRLGVVVDGRPVIFPVNYVLDGQVIVFRSDPGSKLSASSLDRVCFESDEIDPSRREGWSVVVHGIGREFTDALDATSVREQAMALTTWVSGEKGHWVRIVAPSITGRRIRHDDDAAA